MSHRCLSESLAKKPVSCTSSTRYRAITICHTISHTICTDESQTQKGPVITTQKRPITVSTETYYSVKGGLSHDTKEAGFRMQQQEH
jgi:hypothetical protein